ncbi:glycosyltransferase [Thioclava sp.]|uniref:glycosyltransferase n=1 Tax=Thioclava sp. TaxID=1933450 RepID=UPI003AA8D036
MNAWYFTFEYPPEFGGGLSTYMRIVTEAYAERSDASLVVFTLSNRQSGLMSRRYLHDNVQLITINPNQSLEKDELGHWVNVARLFERFSDLFMMQIDTGLRDLVHPDYVEFADGFGIGSLTIQQKLCLNSRLQDVPIIVTAHTPTYLIDRLNQIPTFKLPHYWTGQLELQALCGADLVIGCAKAILDLLDKEVGRTGAKLGPCKVLHNPFPVEDSAALDAPPRGSYDHFYMASRLTHWKGVESAIRAFEILWNEGIKVPFYIYGEDTFFTVTGTNYSEYIEKRYKKYIDGGLLTLKGKCPRSEISKISKTAYAQVHPSHFDNFPYSVLEAMSEGTKCVAGSNGGIREIATDEDDIFLTNVEDPQKFAAALRKAYNLSENTRITMRSNAKSKIKRHCDPKIFLLEKEKMVRELSAQKCSAPKSFPFLSPPKESCVFEAASISDGNPELSIIVPYFNMADYIDETLDSISNSTFKNFETILINDGSTDQRSIELLGQLHTTHGLNEKQLRIINIQNGGVANARNTGVKHSLAPFIALLDSDDLIGARYYEKAMRILKTYENVSFCGAWIEDYNADGRIRNWATWNAEPPIQLIMNQTNCQSLIYKRAAFEQSGWHDPDLRMFLDDWEGMISLLAGGHRGVMIPEALFEYRIRSESIFRSGGGLWDINYEKITQKHRELYNEWGADIAAFLNVNGPNNFYHVAGKEGSLRK